PWIEYVVTKNSTNASTTTLLPVDQVHAQMTEGARRALQNLARMKPMKIATPVKTALHARPPASLAFMDSVPGITYAVHTVSFAETARSESGIFQVDLTYCASRVSRPGF